MNKAAYHHTVHAWLRANFGRPNKCENIYCKNESTIFHWAKINGKPYACNRDFFNMLCSKCHSQQDHRFKKHICRECQKNYTKKEGSFIDGILYCISLFKQESSKEDVRLRLISEIDLLKDFNNDST